MAGLLVGRGWKATPDEKESTTLLVSDQSPRSITRYFSVMKKKSNNNQTMPLPTGKGRKR